MSSSLRIRNALLVVALLCALSAPAPAQTPDCTGISSVIASNKDMTGDLTSIRLATGLSSPVHLTVAPGDDTRLFVVEQPGGNVRSLSSMAGNLAG